jgi:outer membrane receptor protein involved in Fe transport
MPRSGRGFHSFGPLIIAVVATAMTGSPASAQNLDQQHVFDLEAEDAVKAIPEFARQADIEIVAPAASLAGIRMPAIKGTYNIRVALEMLLANTDLEIGSDEGGVITLHRRPRAPVSLPRPATRAPSRTAQATQEQISPEASPQPLVSLEEILITGSRIVRDGYQAPTPVTVMAEQQIQAAGHSTLSDFVNELPAVAGSTTPNTLSVSSGAQGLAALNLRSLGTTRTLVLLDGQRSVASVVTGQVDVNNFPQDLVSRIDIVTGGASAAYGSDALSGVVNFVLNKSFTGVKGAVEGGTTTYGDDRNWKVTLTGGGGFGHSRGHLLLSGELYRNEGVLDQPRAWNNHGAKIVINPGYTPTGGLPQYLVLNDVGLSNASPGGIIVSGPLRGIEFGPGGIPRQFNYGSVTNDPFTQGGDWAETNSDRYSSLDAAMHRQSIFGRVSYDIRDNFNAFAQLSWNDSYSFAYDNRQYNVGNITIEPDNAFIPAVISAQVRALNLTSLTIGSMNADLGPFATSNDRITTRYVIGASGHFDVLQRDWSWDAYYQKGITRASENIFNTTLKSNFALAIDAIRTFSGAIVCRSTLTDPGNGCVPWDVMGIGVNSDAAKRYITAASPHRNERFVEDAFQGNVRGEPFANWAGPISVALGIEHRREGVSGRSTLDDQNNNFFVGNFLPNLGHFSVTEGYAELVVPVLKGARFAKALELNAAMRATGYSISGYVTTWKAGLTYAPVGDLRLRFTRSRDIRAPNLSELFSSGTANTNNVTDPFNANRPTQYQGFQVGNLHLRPEVADASGLGLVLQPSFAPGLNASIDYYAIDIHDAIGTLAAQDILNFCFQGRQEFCDAITRGMINGVPVFARIQLSPFNFVRQRARGIDLEASYDLPLASLLAFSRGHLTVRMLATRFLENYSDNGINAPIDTVGSNSTSGPPSWRYLATLTYSQDRIRLTLTGRGVSAGTYNNAWILCSSACPAATADHPTVNFNHIAGAFYLDANVNWNFGDRTGKEIFLTIKNIANTDPATVHQGPIGTTFKAASDNPALYDVLGRVFRVGFRFRM